MSDFSNKYRPTTIDYGKIHPVETGEGNNTYILYDKAVGWSELTLEQQKYILDEKRKKQESIETPHNPCNPTQKEIEAFWEQK